MVNEILPAAKIVENIISEFEEAKTSNSEFIKKVRYEVVLGLHIELE